VKFTSISVYELTLELRVPFTTSFGTYKTLTRPFVLATTSDGFRGLGEIPTMIDPAYKAEADTISVLTSLKEFVLPSVAKYQNANGEISDFEELKDSFSWIKGASFAKSGVEAALWDIKAQSAEVPLWKLWGGTRASFPVGVSIGGKTIDHVLSLADNAVSLGYKRLKVKIWPGFDVQVVTALRDRFPEILLQIDANSAYNRTNWEPLKELDELDLLLIEQPLYDDDIVFHSELSKDLRTPVCLDESIHSLLDVEAAISLWRRNNVLDRLIINIKPPRVSGFSEAIAIADLCQANGVRTWIGGMLDTAWGKAVNLNLNSLDAITLPGDHFSPSGAYFEQDIVTQPLVATGGNYTLGDGISAGVEIDWEVFKSLGQKVFEQRFE
jgi:O-succinylbenzoate synthase